MQIHELPPERPVLRRFSEEMWLPYHRELEETVDSYALVPDIEERLSEEVDFRLDLLETDSYCGWVAVDGAVDRNRSLANTDRDFIGFVLTDIDRCPSVFDRPDRLVIGDIYVTESYRGTGLAGKLVEQAVQRASDVDCPELSLDVDVDNGRALGFYRKLGFEPLRHEMTASVRDVQPTSDP